MYRVGVDIGGTFTDVVVADDAGDLVRAKALTTPADYTEGVTNAIGNAAAELGITVEALMGDCAGFVNGTTVVTPGGTPEPLVAGGTRIIEPGTQVILADEVSFVYEVTA